MAVERFEDLEVWQEAMTLTTSLYKELKDCRNFSLRDQIQRSAVSIASNIAEGFERKSNKEFIQHLYIAKGSCGELRTQLYLCKELNIIDKTNLPEMLEQTRKISAKLVKLIRTRSERF